MYDAAIAYHTEQARNTLMNSTCSQKWWDTLKGFIFDVKNYIPAHRGSNGLVVTPANKASLLCSQFDIKQCHFSLVFLSAYA